MNSDQIVGRIGIAHGRIVEVTARIFGSKPLEANGIARQTAGHVRAGNGDLRNCLRTVHDPFVDGR